jgi:hypothetical protein
MLYQILHVNIMYGNCVKIAEEILWAQFLVNTYCAHDVVRKKLDL